MSGTSMWKMLKASVVEFFDDEAMTRAAAVAFYTALSFAPLLILLIWISSSLSSDITRQMVQQVEQVVGPQAGEAVDMVVKNAEQEKNAGTLAGMLSILVLLFSASSVFAQLQKSMNRIWDVERKPGAGVGGWLRTRLLSFGMLLVIAFLLAVSLVVSAGISMIGSGGAVWQVLNLIASLLIFFLLFAAMFKLLPDVHIEWGDVWVGAAITASLFIVGKYAIGKYLGMSSVGSAYGAAGSLVVLLVWVYYSTLIFFFGAELTQEYARRFGTYLAPNRHAQWAEDAPEKKGEAAGGGRPSPVTRSAS